MPALLGCIADDLTGGTDLSGILVNNGMRTVQMIGVPEGPWPANADAVVVALKSRTIPVDNAVKESLAALRWLQAAGCPSTTSNTARPSTRRRAAISALWPRH